MLLALPETANSHAEIGALARQNGGVLGALPVQVLDTQ